MGVKGDNVLLAGVNEGTESPNKVAKEAKRTFAAGLDLLHLKKSKLSIHNHGIPAGTLQLFIMNYEFEVCPASGSVSPDQP